MIYERSYERHFLTGMNVHVRLECLTDSNLIHCLFELSRNSSIYFEINTTNKVNIQTAQLGSAGRPEIYRNDIQLIN